MRGWLLSIPVFLALASSLPVSAGPLLPMPPPGADAGYELVRKSSGRPKTVRVRDYVKKNGTYVAAHRSAAPPMK